MSNYTWEYIKQHPQEVQRLHRNLSSNRIFIEHLIRIVKIFKVSQERFRLNKNRYVSVLLTICGLVRLRKGSLILEIVKAANSSKTIDVIKHHSFGIDLPRSKSTA